MRRETSVLLMLLLFLNSCTKNINNEKVNFNNLDSIKKNQVKSDSIVIKYWKSEEANEYKFYYTKDTLHISSEYFNFEKTIEDNSINMKFSNYANDLYSGNQSIIFSKKNNLRVVSDYSRVDMMGYRKKNKVFNKQIILYSTIEFNPKFLEFLEFLEELIKKE